MLDLGIITAGASTSALLADLGADVIKIESPTYIDPFRKWEAGSGNGAWWNQSQQFRFTNRNKRGVAVDLKQEQGRELFLRLVEKSHVVVENFRRGALESMRLGFEQLRERNPAIILASISSQGETGPLRDMVSYGSTLEALGGMSALTGYEGGPPTISGRLVNYPDQVASLFAAGCIVDALLDQESGRPGVHLDISQRELTTYLLGEEIMSHLSATGDTSSMGIDSRAVADSELSSGPTARHLTRGNLDPSVEFQGCFQSADGAWVVLSLCDAEDVSSWWRVCGSALPQGDSHLGLGIQDHAPALRTAVQAWVSERTAAEASAHLNESGIPAVVVRDEDPQQLGRQDPLSPAFSTASDGGLVKGLPFEMDGLVLAPSPAPELGEHNVEVLSELIGLSHEQIDELGKTGVLGTVPTA